MAGGVLPPKGLGEELVEDDVSVDHAKSLPRWVKFVYGTGDFSCAFCGLVCCC